MDYDKEKIIFIKYKNYKGELNNREIVPIEIWYGSTKYHTSKQWLLKAYDLGKQDFRNFALKDIENWNVGD
ncbi:WYL domain-containing protein [Desulfosporosinus sp. FKB]|uniref:WYL domain-containing protein n=1 Tax=Desulfosporosinus sp. FKB TaxID=1969835 RepID=UPI000B49D7A8|nr:WYL domain-containing protein [Desulfosporosinus sp. FKB]